MIGDEIKGTEIEYKTAAKEDMVFDERAIDTTPERSVVHVPSPFAKFGKDKNRNVLYHYIDGFVIEEADTPFNSEIGSLLTKRQLEDIWKKQQELIAEENKLEQQKFKQNFAGDNVVRPAGVQICEYCGVSGSNHYSSRFCTLLCCRRSSVSRARRFKVRAQKIRDASKQLVQLGTKRKYFDTPPMSPVRPEMPVVPDESGKSVRLSPSKWTVDNVCTYIESLPDSKAFAADFRNHEIDGSALLLIKEDHLISSLNIKLGPALKLCSHIRELHEMEA